MLILIDKNTLRMIASASNHKLMALVQKWDFPEVNGLVVDSEIGREWTALDEDQMGILYMNMSGQEPPDYKTAIEQLRAYAGQWTEYPKPLSYFEDLEKQQAIPHPVTTEEAAIAQNAVPPEPEPDDEELPQSEVEPDDKWTEAELMARSRANHQAIITGVEKANAALTPEQKEAAKASAPTKPEKEKSAEPSAPRKPGATKMVWDIADARHAANPGLDVKTLRKMIVAECEANGINGGTAATQFGKWKASKGL